MNRHDKQHSRQTPLAFLTGYGLAAASTSLAALVRWLLPGALAPAPYLGFYPAVVVAAALGGVGPGLVATFGSMLLVNFVFGRFNIHGNGAIMRQVIWMIAGIAVSLLAGMQRAARRRENQRAEELRRLNDELEKRVEERTAEILQANRKLRSANEKLADLNRDKTAFFSNISHEFRTPLTLMLGPLEDALARPDYPAAADREALTMVHRNALRLLQLVNMLLDFSRIEVGRIQAVYEPTDLAHLTADLASVFRSAVERAGMTLEIDCAPLADSVYVDIEMWGKIVLNLLSNALKFTLEGGIKVRLAETDGMAELAVIDTGIGIEPHELPNLFDRFHRVREVKGRIFEGAGISLSLVHELVKLHGGNVSVESTPGQGTTFTVRLPLGTAHLPADRIGASRTRTLTTMETASFVEEASRFLSGRDWLTGEAEEGEKAPAALSGNAEPRTPEAGRRSCILLVDDNADMRAYLLRLLEKHYDITTAADGETALAAALAAPPDLVLSDVMMPRMDGFELLRALRRTPETATVPVILLSALAGEESRVEGMEAGADDYLVKPFSPRELLARVKAHLELAQSRREAETLRRLADDHLRTTRQAKALQEKNWDLGRLNRAMVGRELRMIELKQEVNNLCAQAGEPVRYVLDSGEAER